MSISNKKGCLVLTTGNKSEMAVGYSTLYGDMAGGFDVLKDVPKTLVFELGRYRNCVGPVHPATGDRPPAVGGAGARPERRGQLPPYERARSHPRACTWSGTFSAEAIIATGYRPRTGAPRGAPGGSQ